MPEPVFEDCKVRFCSSLPKAELKASFDCNAFPNGDRPQSFAGIFSSIPRLFVREALGPHREFRVLALIALSSLVAGGELEGSELEFGVSSGTCCEDDGKDDLGSCGEGRVELAVSLFPDFLSDWAPIAGDDVGQAWDDNVDVIGTLV